MKYEIVNESTPAEPAPVKIRLVLDTEIPTLQFQGKDGKWYSLAWLTTSGGMVSVHHEDSSILLDAGFMATDQGSIMVQRVVS